MAVRSFVGVADPQRACEIQPAAPESWQEKLATDRKNKTNFLPKMGAAHSNYFKLDSALSYFASKTPAMGCSLDAYRLTSNTDCWVSLLVQSPTVYLITPSSHQETPLLICPMTQHGKLAVAMLTSAVLHSPR